MYHMISPIEKAMSFHTSLYVPPASSLQQALQVRWLPRPFLKPLEWKITEMFCEATSVELNAKKKLELLSSSDPHPDPFFWHSFSPTIWKSFFLAYTLTFFLAFYLASILTYLLAYILTFFLAFYLAWHIFWHSFWHSIWYIFGDSLWLRSGGALSDPELKCCSGPAGNTAI